MHTASRRVMTTVDEFVDPVVAARMSPMVLRPGAMRAEIVNVDLGDVTIDLLSYSFAIATRGETFDDRVGFSLPLKLSSASHMNGERIAHGTLYAYGGAAEVAAATSGPAEFAVVSFDVEQLNRTARALGVEVDLPDRGEFRALPATDLARLRRLLLDTRQAVRDTGNAGPGAHAAATLSDELFEIGVQSFAADVGRDRPSHARLNSVHIARACEEFAASSQYQSVTLTDLCRASGASERRVRQAFYESYGMSPTAYLRVAALHEVRRALFAKSPARGDISRIASDYGFWHLSRFAGQYRALFGESPSATCARTARAEAG